MLPQNNIVAFPVELSRPAFNRERLKEARLEKQWTQTGLAHAIEVTPETVSNLESGDRQPGAETLAKLCDKLGYSPGYFSLPDGEGGKLDSPIFFRSFASKKKRQNHSLNVWRLRAGRILAFLAKFVNLPPVRLPKANWSADDSAEELTERAESLAQECRRTWGIGDGPIGNLTRLLESMGVCVVRLDVPDMEDVDGFSCWQDGRPMIFIISQTSAARERLNLAHEVLHLIAHRDVAVDSVEDKTALKVRESQAFAFGGALLAPRSTYGREVISFSISHFTQLKRRWGLAIAGQGKRCVSLGIMDEDRYIQLRKNLSWGKQLVIEPLDESTPNEAPLMMRQAIEILSEHKVITGWQIAEKFGLPPSKMHQFTTLPEDYFAPPSEPTPSMHLLA